MNFLNICLSISAGVLLLLAILAYSLQSEPPVAHYHNHHHRMVDDFKKE